MLDGVFECELGASKKPKEQRSIRSMRIHFIWFLQQHILYDSFFPLVQLPLKSMNYVMACYACHLVTGHSLSSQTLKVGTIRKYLIAAASFVAVFDSGQGLDTRKEKGLDSLCPALDKVLKEQKQWEDVPDRHIAGPWAFNLPSWRGMKELPFSVNTRPSLTGSWSHSMVAFAVRDGPRTGGIPASTWLNGTPATLDDIQFQGANGRPLTHSAVLSHPALAPSLTVRWRMQKNGDHGEKKLFTRNDEDSRLCCVHHWIRILQRFVEMHGYARNILLASYWSQYHDSSVYTSENIETAMRETVASYYELDPVKDKSVLQKFSAHSLRVGACITLQAMGFFSHQIQQMLRWKSESWLMYTRNLHVVSQQQNEAIFKASLLKVI
jgi:hypothetical protein